MATIPSNIPTRKPVVRRMTGKSLSIAVSGKEQDYPVYRFSGKVFNERPNHEPFKGL